MSLFHLLFGFSGRANRGKFWLAVVLWIIFWAIAVPVCVLAAIIILGLHLPDSSLPHDELIARYVRLAFDYLGLLIVFIAFTVVSWISAFAVGAKRLHDRDKSGWWILLFYLAPSVLGSIANTNLASSPLPVLSLGSALSSSRSGRWSSLVSCAGPSVPTGMDPIRCNRSPPLPLLPHLPVPEIGLRVGGHGARGTRPCSRARRQHATSRDQSPPRLRNFCTRLPCTSAE